MPGKSFERVSSAMRKAAVIRESGGGSGSAWVGVLAGGEASGDGLASELELRRRVRPIATRLRFEFCRAA